MWSLASKSSLPMQSLSPSELGTLDHVYFSPWIGDNYHLGFRGRRFLILGESHYDTWNGVKHELDRHFTNECVTDALKRPKDGGPFWKFVEQILVNESRVDGWAPSGLTVWPQLAFYNFVQSPMNGKAGVRPSRKQFIQSRLAFTQVLEHLRPERVLVCGKKLWSLMGPTHKEDQLNPCPSCLPAE